MRKRLLLTIILTLAVAGYVFAQRGEGSLGGSISGYVFDSEFNTPVEYATVVVFSMRDSSQVTGIITDENGYFKLDKIRPGNYYLEISFLGYTSKTIDNVELNPYSPQVDLGQISLTQAAFNMDDVEVTAERLPIEYHIDKKVVNVDQQLTTVTGTAVDVLENVPSVTVDLEGNVSLRGSSNFTVLIDGRPTILDANDALQQIPASAIDNIEIITNPSAKYDPDGTSGIINVILKKNSLRGASGIVNLNGGLNDKYGGDFLINYRKGIVNAQFGIDYNYRHILGTREEENRTTQDGYTSYINSDGDSYRDMTRYGLRGNIDLNLTAKDVFSFGGRWGGREFARSADLDYDEWAEPDSSHSFFTSFSESEHSGYFYAANIEYLHRFNNKGHEIVGRAIYGMRNMESAATNELFELNGYKTSGQKNIEDGPGHRATIKLDYTLPFENENKLEAGYQSRFGGSEDATEQYEYDPDTSGYIFRPEYSHSIDYKRHIQSLYAIYSGEAGKLGYQGGFRSEYTYRAVEYVVENEKFTLDRWDYFPSVHLSYQLPGKNQLMASYSRRIERPRGWYLEPFLTWMDAYNVRQGNPALKPEYIDSYELGYQTFLGKSMFSSEAYYRITHNVIDRVRTVYDANVTLHTMENVGTDYSFGTEFMLNSDLFKWWNVNCMGNIFNYRLEGSLFGESYSRESFSWKVRLNNTFMLAKNTRLQFNGEYNSSIATSQGEREGFFMTSLALKQEFPRQNLAATLQVMDIFGSGKHEFTSQGVGFYFYSKRTREAPMVMLNISFNINNYQKERQEKNNLENFESGDDF